MRRQRIDARQISLFSLLAERAKDSAGNSAVTGRLNLQTQLKASLTQALKDCPLSRYQVAASMSELLGTEISKSMLDAYTAESKEYHRFPAEYLSAFCEVTGSSAPLTLIAQSIDMFLLPGEEALRAEIQWIDEQEGLLKNEKKKRKVLLSQLMQMRQAS